MRGSRVIQHIESRHLNEYYGLGRVIRSLGSLPQRISTIAKGIASTNLGRAVGIAGRMVARQLTGPRLGQNVRSILTGRGVNFPSARGHRSLDIGGLRKGVLGAISQAGKTLETADTLRDRADSLKKQKKQSRIDAERTIEDEILTAGARERRSEELKARLDAREKSEQAAKTTPDTPLPVEPSSGAKVIVDNKPTITDRIRQEVQRRRLGS
jgi:hypothetical protein